MGTKSYVKLYANLKLSLMLPKKSVALSNLILPRLFFLLTSIIC